MILFLIKIPQLPPPLCHYHHYFQVMKWEYRTTIYMCAAIQQFCEWWFQKTHFHAHRSKLRLSAPLYTTQPLTRRRVGRAGGYIDMFSYYPSSSDPTNCAAMYSLIPTTIHSFNWKNIWQIHTNQFHAATTPAIISANPPTHSKSTTDNVMKSVLLSSPRRVVVHPSGVRRPK